MTTIAYRWGVLAADTLMCAAGSILGEMVKIARRNDGVMAGAAGSASYCGPFLTWFMGGENGEPPAANESDRYLDRGLIFRGHDTIDVFEPGGKFTVQAEYYATGSGMDYALGAMWSGKGAAEAVRAACAHDPHSGGSITVLRFDHDHG